ncbi:MAG: aspartate aminotransferase family protein [Balneolaceae bacterium]|nr:aspartate aminotransferase family protein [Balneolaceae bacterium]
MNNFSEYLPLLRGALKKIDEWRTLYGDDSSGDLPAHLSSHAIESVLSELEKKLRGNYPFHHPQYAGQMLKPPHPAAWLAYSLAMTINPNNHALDGGPPTSEMEKEVVKLLANMIGYDSNHLGHLTSGGTVANLEALFVAREIHPEKAIAATSNAHYTHSRMCHLLRSDYIEIPVDLNGSPDLDFIESNAAKIGTLVVTMGTTGLGVVEPLDDILKMADRFGFRVHADAAYGGFFKIIENELPSKKQWQQLHLCDSVVIDPHKHGLQPYGCGSIFFRDASAGKYFKHDSPYTYFTSDDLHLGEISIECSRAGASAAALWTTLQLLPLTSSGLGSVLRKTRSAATKFAELLSRQAGWKLYNTPDLDITGYFKEPKIKSIKEMNRISRQIFEAGMKNQQTGFHLSLFTIGADHFLQKYPEYTADNTRAVILRSVFMKEEHEPFIDELSERIFSVETD